ncbi:MAG TPA: carboxypeptidase-like regulatory domain-containing protein [Candidatus Sulfotelmatobacter sp.]|nr:carboxypeptidase-like regulatory domain-containing protein [Candidatus Sulfotelmatobacter sp.]
MKIFVLLFLVLPSSLLAQEIALKGRVVDPRGNALPKATIQLLGRGQVLAETTSGPDGQFQLKVTAAGDFVLEVNAAGFRPVKRPVTIHASGNSAIEIGMSQISSRIENITVTADVNESDVRSPDPAQRVYVVQELLDANPGRPGAPVSIPGFPVETASSGIKAPQYFAPGVAGDHGEPIAQFIAVGGYLLPNNLSANAHGNGYSDPNLLIPEILEDVQIDGGAFNVREGNHSLNLAATYGLRSILDPFLTVTGDYRDVDVVAGASPTPKSWLALEASFGNGFLDRLEHRQQYKFNGERFFHAGQHQVTLLGIAYYGQSYVPGLVPIFAPNAGDPNVMNHGDTIDPRQKDQTHTALLALNDLWQLSPNQQLQLSGFFRTYNLSLFSDFGQGLIRQSEFRTVAGGSADYLSKIALYLSLLAGIEYEREAPRRDDLDQYTANNGLFNPAAPMYYGPFTPTAANNVTIAPVTPYVAVEGTPARFFRYYLGWRRDEININNQDLLNPQHSFHNWVGVNSPKATLSFLPKDAWFAPLISLSFGQAFFTNDPRIGAGTAPETPVSTAHSYQLVASKTLHRTDLRLTLGHVTTSGTFAKLDPDTGLQIAEGPGRLRLLSIAVQQSFKQGSLLATFSKADARDLTTGEPTPEAPRTIFDFLGTIQRLPFQLQARGEFEYVGLKPLGTGCLPVSTNQCVGTPVKEFRGALVRPFLDGRLDAGIHFLVASGYTGQTTENFSSSAIQEVVGIRIPSCASITLTYRFGRSSAP